MYLPYVAMMLASALLVRSQRPSFAGNRPIGYPELYDRTTTPVNELGNRFGEGTTQRLPLEANGDRDLIDRLSKLPIDQQPFWFINWQALEEHRKNPQTYPQRPNIFLEANNGISTGNSNTGFGAGNSNNGIPSSGVPSNGVPSNGVPSNGVPSNGVPSNGVPSNGFPSNGVPNVNTGVPNFNSVNTNGGVAPTKPASNGVQNTNSRPQNTNVGSPVLQSDIPNYDLLVQNANGGTVQSSSADVNDPNRAIIITPQGSNSGAPSFGSSSFSNGGPFANTNSPKVNRSPSTNEYGGVLNNLSPSNVVPLSSNNLKNSNTQRVVSSSNTKNKDTGISTSSNFQSENTNSFFVNGNPPPNSLPAIPGFNSRISETSGPNAGGAQVPVQSVQGGNTESPNTKFSTYSYGYENHYNYKYNYSYEIPYTYTTHVRHP